MPTVPSSSAQAAREALAGRLKEIRRDAGLTGHDLAVRCGWHKAKSSRIENAKTTPSDADIRAWCAACDAEDQAPDLIAANRAAESMYMQWRRLHRKQTLRFIQEGRVPLNERTKLFRSYSSSLISGFLQTERYAAAVLESVAWLRELRDDIPSAVAARLARSRVLREGDHRFVMLLEEAVLRYQMGDAEAMADQLGHLLSVMSLPSVSLGVIPSKGQRPIWAVETFNVYDDEHVHVELLTAEVTVTAPGEVRDYLKTFVELQKRAVYGSRARALITAAIDDLG
ncbi:helix-turn-helix transcriptional regulator [Streptomyces sp. AV19]|uniref:helix-turn-helix domain-containing protein n=1 Tax=Streptomyces sp. AV19 TaxID=2793068 RepID=UPI0018FE3CE7|nr:helix-turn-helix transcriptional regulator [Streptomyces sp. AV19]MBH1933191.1 helix-turn-helix transcriptional regulator [Streptomyces sp. AV19]MDG4531909.1 helix-turn-helix transcriptional regulator [Streptomyces sp. AV19]